MALIIDPDNLTRSSTSGNLGVDGNIWIETTTKTIKLAIFGSLTTDGVTLKCIYSFLKEEWKNDAELIKYPFPMVPLTDEQFEFSSGWNFDKTGSGNSFTPNLVRTSGWAVKNTSNVTTEMWAGVITLGSIQAGGQVYYTQYAGDTAHDINLTGAVNQAIQIYSDPNGDGSTADGFDRRSYLKLFLREQGNAYASSQLSDIGVSTLSYQAYRFPLADSDDSKITVSDIGIDVNTDGTADVAPYSGMSITWVPAGFQRNINGTPRDFHVLIDGNQGTLQQIYEFVQWSLRQSTDIDAGVGNKTGNLTNELVYFVGSDLYTKLDSTGGVYIDDYRGADTNLIHFTDDTGTIRNNARSATLTINFGDNLKNDAASIYRVFFTNDDAGDNLGYDYGTANAITVKDALLADMTGSVTGLSTITKSYDFDNNDQRGVASKGTDVPVTAVGIGLTTGQFVVATGTISGATLSGTISLVSALERQYENP